MPSYHYHWCSSAKIILQTTGPGMFSFVSLYHNLHHKTSSWCWWQRQNDSCNPVPEMEELAARGTDHSLWLIVRKRFKSQGQIKNVNVCHSSHNHVDLFTTTASLAYHRADRGPNLEPASRWSETDIIEKTSLAKGRGVCLLASQWAAT